MGEPVRHRRTKGAATDMFEPKATASHLDSTQMRSINRIEQCPSSGIKRKTYARGEFFAVCPSTDIERFWHPGDAHTLIDALPAGEINGVVTRYGGAIAAYRKGRIERKSCLRGSPRLARRSEQRLGRGEMEMAEGIIVVAFEAPAQPSDRFSIGTQLQLGEADPHHPIAGIGIAGRQAERLVNVGLGLGCATKWKLGGSYKRVRRSKISIHNQGLLAFGDTLSRAVRCNLEEA